MGLRGAVWRQSGVSGAGGFVGLHHGPGDQERVEMGSGDQQNNSAPMKTTRGYTPPAIWLIIALFAAPAQWRSGAWPAAGSGV